jgi:hypothetical protein
MALSIDINTEDLSRVEKLIRSALSEYVPSGNFREGTVLNDLVVRAMAVIPALVEKEARQVRARQSLNSILTLSPEDVDAALEDLVSNWFVTRKDGTRSTGVATLHFSSSVGEIVEVPLDAQFVFSTGIEFVVDSQNPIVINRDDQMRPLLASDGSVSEYLLYLPIISTGLGGSGNVPAGIFERFSPFSPHLTYVELENPIATAVATETNSDLIERAKESLSERGLVTQRSLRAVLREEVADVQDVYVVGAGAPEMQRDLIKDVSYNIDIHVLGHVNVYCLLPVVRNARYPYDGSSISIPPSQVSTPIDTLAVTSFPFLRLKSVSISSGGAYTPLVRASIHSYDDNGVTKYKAYRSDTDSYSARVTPSLLPDEYSLGVESSSLFSSMSQSLSLKTASSVLARTAIIEYDGTRSLSSVDLILQDRNRRIAAANTLGYSHIPVVLKISISYYRKSSAPGSLPEQEAKSAICSYLNNNLFPDGLRVSDLVVFFMGTYDLYVQGVALPITINYYLQSPSGNEVKFSTTNNITVEDMSLLSDSTSYNDDTRLLEQVSDNTVRFVSFEDLVTLTELT